MHKTNIVRAWVLKEGDFFNITPDSYSENADVFMVIEDCGTNKRALHLSTGEEKIVWHNKYITRHNPTENEMLSSIPYIA